MYKVIVEFDPWARMGNRMFQYALGYILAKNKNYEFYHDGLPNFNIEPNPFRGDRDKLINPIYSRRRFGNHYIDIDKLKNHEGDIIIDSYAQKAAYYLDHREELIQHFNFKSENVIPDSDLLMHIRETDAADLNFFLGYEYYKKVIENTEYKNYHIVTDNAYCDAVQQLVKDGCKLVTEGYVDKFELKCNSRAMVDFSALCAAENILLSQSSFSWWAAFLNNHTNVIFPYKTSINFWPINPEKDDIDLFFNLKGEGSRFVTK